MTEREFGFKAKSIIQAYYLGFEKKHIELTNIFVVWVSKVLQNNKALLATNEKDNFYFEVTYNGDKDEFYLDVYNKTKNFVISNEQVVTLDFKFDEESCITTFGFGEAINRLKACKKVARRGWNGPNQFVYYVPANRYYAQTEAAKSIANEDGTVPYNHYMALRTTQGTISTWVPSVTDCLADDWYEVN